MDQIEHIHNRSDMYVGAANKQTEHNEYVVNVATKPENQADNPKLLRRVQLNIHLHYCEFLLKDYQMLLIMFGDHLKQTHHAK